MVGYILAMIALIGVDQWTKHWAVVNLVGQSPQTWIPHFLGFRYAENTGAAFSILRDQQLLLIVLTFLIMAMMFGFMYKAHKTDAHWVVKWAYTLILAGAIGNFIDRIRLDYVIDFLEFKFITFPIFNVADVCVVLGVILLGFSTIFLKYDF